MVEDNFCGYRLKSQSFRREISPKNKFMVMAFLELKKWDSIT